MAEAVCEQLVYTWAVRAGGTAGFDVAATSPGFDPAFVPKAKLVCEHPGEPEDPDAFGWVPVGDRVMWFRRGGDEPDGFGRRGTFCAHVRVADRRALDMGAVASQLRSTTWITGRAELHGRVLDTIEVSGRSVDPPRALTAVDAAIAAAALEAWSGGGRLAVLGPPASVLDVMVELTSLAPWLFWDRSFCSWLQRGAKGVFSIQGITERTAAPADAVVVELADPVADPAVLELAAEILSAKHSAETEAAISAARRSGEQIDFDVLVRTYRTGVALRAGASVSAAQVVELLSNEGTARLAFGNSGFRRRAAELATGDHLEVWNYFVTHIGAVEPSERMALGVELWRASRSGDPTLAADRAGRVHVEVWQGLVTAAAEDVDAEPDLIDGFGTRLLCDLGAVRPESPWVADAARLAGLRKPAEALTDERLDPSFLGIVAATAVRSGDQAAIRATAASGRLTAAGAAVARDEGWLVEYAHKVAARAVDRPLAYESCAVAYAGTPDLVALGAAAVRSASLASAPAVLKWFTTKLDGRVSVDWGPLAAEASQVAAAAVEAGGWPLYLDSALAKALSTMAGDPVAAAWTSADAALDERHSAADVSRRAAALRVLDRKSFTWASLLAFYRVSAGARTGAQLVDWFRELTGDDDPERAARTCVRAAQFPAFTPYPERAVVVALLAVGTLYPDSKNPLKKAPTQVLAAVRTLVARQHQPTLLFVERYREHLPRWISKLVAESPQLTP